MSWKRFLRDISRGGSNKSDLRPRLNLPSSSAYLSLVGESNDTNLSVIIADAFLTDAKLIEQSRELAY